MVYGDHSSEPPGVTVRLFKNGEPMSPKCISYALINHLTDFRREKIQTKITLKYLTTNITGPFTLLTKILL